MTVETVLLLLGAGLLGGIANAMAGGASLITFPAMLAAGLAPIPANASNALAVVFGNVMGAWTERHKLPRIDAAMLVTFAAATVGGAGGAVLLLLTPESVFVLVVPALIGFATLIFAFSRFIQKWFAHRFGAGNAGIQACLVFPVSLYGGYFGAGFGVMLMAVFSATSSWDLRSANSLKNLLCVLANAAAIVIFIFRGVISWPETLVMMAACIVGGFLGGNALKFISIGAMRAAITTIGFAMTVYYIWRYWF